MAQYLPAPPMHSPGGVPHQPDDGDVQTRAPSICVDYLSHTWEEEDVWASWRSITRRKNEVANGVRLENASWRTWWKQRNKLKTISPETLNWLKDSDVTWLYGPLHTAVEAVPPPKVATAEERLNLVSASSGKKPILKHRTLSEILTTPMPSSPVLESLDFGDDDMSDDSLGGPAKPYSLLQTKSDTNIFRRTSTSRKSSPYRGANQPPLAQSPESEVPGGKKHISFNTFVEQCISLDEPTSIAPDRPYDDDNSDDEDDDDDDVLEMRSTSSVGSSSSKPSLSRQSSSTEKEHFTIAHIAPARLKTTGNVEDDINVVQHTGSSSASSHSGSSRYIPHDQSSSSQSSQGDFRSSIDSAQWDDDDDDAFDYFGGPGRGGSSASGRSAAGGNALGSRGASVAPSGVGSVGHYEGTSSNTSSNNSSTSLNDAPGLVAKSTDSAAVPTASAPRRGASTPYTPPVSSSKDSTPPSGNSSSSERMPSGSPSDANSSHRINPGPSRSILKNRSANSGGPSTSPETQTSYFVPPSNTSAAHTSSNTSANAASSGAASQAFLPPVSGSTGHTPISQLPISAHASSEENTTRGRSSTRSSSSTSLSDRVPSRSNSGGTSTSPTTATGPVSSTSGPLAATAAVGRGAKPPSIKTVNITGQPLKPTTSEDGGSDGPASGLGSPKSGEGFWADGDEKRDDEGVDESYKYAESTNPTPNSSPLISMRNLTLDSSAASLPHAQSKPSASGLPTSPNPALGPGAPGPIQPTTTNPGGASSVTSPGSATSSLQRTTSNNSTVNPFAAAGGEDKDAAGAQSGGNGNGKAGATGVVATARDLLGALWGMAGEGAKKA